MGLDGGAIDIGGNNDVALFLLGMADGRDIQCVVAAVD